MNRTQRRSLATRTKQNTARHGRALVECIVAMFLLAITALSMTATVRGTLSLVGDATLVARAQALATTRVEDVMALPCGANASGTDQTPRLTLLWQQAGSTRSTRLHIDLTLDRSPIAFANTSLQYGIDAGGICP